ncbi:MAG: hypothetical protein ACOVOQ_14855 [Flavobacterium sp.]|jgi:hypothetical protein
MSNNKESSVVETAIEQIYQRILDSKNPNTLTKRGGEYRIGLQEAISILEVLKEKYEHEMCLFADEYASYVLEQSKPRITGAMVSMCAWTFFKNRKQ